MTYMAVETAYFDRDKILNAHFFGFEVGELNSGHKALGTFCVMLDLS